MIILVLLFILVLNEKEAEINQARENYEEEMKKTIEESQKTIKITKTQSIEEEIAKIKEDYEKELKDKEDSHGQVLSKYNEQCETWQLEKQVSDL